MIVESFLSFLKGNLSVYHCLISLSQPKETNQSEEKDKRLQLHFMGLQFHKCQCLICDWFKLRSSWRIVSSGYGSFCGILWFRLQHSHGIHICSVQHQICSIKSPCLLVSSVASTISLMNFLRLMSSVVKPSFFVLFP